MNDLADCRLRHDKYPKTFWIPESDEIDQIRPGDHVKLVFDDLERMWVRVVNHDGQHFEGRLANKPCFVEGISFGDRVCFHVRHIAAIDFAR